ncbi:MAG TPA: hypothetical protein DD710_16035 [Alcanivorax sp.]|nr:hypothetical protein [Alcanivorax sp.]
MCHPPGCRHPLSLPRG